MSSVNEVSSQLGTSLPVDFLWLELTNQCNLQCVHCYAKSGPHANMVDLLNAEDYKRLIDEAYDIGCRQVQFIGGEPTLNRELPKLIRHARRLGYTRVEVFSNLISLSKALLQCFQDNNVSIATSFYSSESEVHDAITQKAGSFERTINNLHRVIEAKLMLRVGIIEMEQNEGKKLQTIEYLHSIGVQNVSVDHLRRFGRAAEEGGSTITELCGNCGGPTLCVGPDGIVSPCIMSKAWPVGSVLKNSLQELARSTTLQAIRSKIHSEVVLPRTKNESREIMNCDPQCIPWCFPGQGCNPCSPAHNP